MQGIADCTCGREAAPDESLSPCRKGQALLQTPPTLLPGQKVGHPSSHGAWHSDTGGIRGWFLEWLIWLPDSGLRYTVQGPGPCPNTQDSLNLLSQRTLLTCSLCQWLPGWSGSWQ